jgi:erythronate-4-phosphate dehydrogenase
MRRIKVVADDKIPFLKGVLEPYVDIEYISGSKISSEDLKDADALFTRTRTRCNKELLEGTGIKLVVTATIGFDHIDTQYCDSAGIRWTNVPGCNSSSVQQYVLSAILNYVRKKNLSLPDLTIGIIGVGNIGRKVAHAAGIIGMNVLLNDPPRAAREGNDCFTDLDTLLAKSDMVTCHVPLNITGKYKTYHLISDEFLYKMKNCPVLINTSRGDVMNTYEVEKNLGYKLSACIIDVWEDEPQISASLLNSTFIGTPHIAGYSSDGKANGTAVCVRELTDFFNPGIPAGWYPEFIPQPPMPGDIYINGSDKSSEQLLYEAVNHTYPILEDSERLKQNVSGFEKLREDYWIRREFNYFTVIAENIDKKVLEQLHQLGFNIRTK